MIDGKNNILKWFENTGFNYFTIYHGKAVESGNYSCKSSELEGITQTDALADLRGKLGLLSNGNYTIVASATARVAPKGTAREEFRISVLETETPKVETPIYQHPVISGIGEDEVNRRIDKAIAEYAAKQELEQLKRENAELKKENADYEKDSPLNRIGAIIADIAPVVLPQILNINQPAPTAKIAGLQAQNNYTMPNEIEESEIDISDADQIKLETALSNFSSVDADGWLDKLLLISEKVKAKPSLLSMINML